MLEEWRGSFAQAVDEPEKEKKEEEKEEKEKEKEKKEEEIRLGSLPDNLDHYLPTTDILNQKNYLPIGASFSWRLLFNLFLRSNSSYTWENFWKPSATHSLARLAGRSC